jgi:hypothetical protein
MTTTNGTAPNAPARKSLSKVVSGKIIEPIRLFLYGAEKVGKSSFCASAPNALFLSFDNGGTQLDISRITRDELRTWQDLTEWMRVLAEDAHEYKTVVFDPINWAEALCHREVIRRDNPKFAARTIEEVGGGYGKGYAAAVDVWRELLPMLERVSARGMHVILTAHTKIRTFRDPTLPEYQRYTPAMNEQAAGLFMQWADDVLFCNHVVSTVEDKSSRVRAVSDGRRVLYTQRDAAYDAGNRHNLPPELPLAWDAYWEAVQKFQTGAGREELIAQIRAMADALKDESVSKKTAEWLSTPHKMSALVEAKNKLATRIETAKEPTS